MKILHLISSGGLYGAEQVLLLLAQNFNSEEDSAVVGAINNLSNPNTQIIDKAKEYGLPTFLLECKGRFDFGSVLRLKKYLIDNKIDLIHTHNYKSNLIGCIAAKWAQIPIVSTIHGFTQLSVSVKFYEFIDRFILRIFFDRVVMVTNDLLSGANPRKIRVIRNGLRISDFCGEAMSKSMARKKLGISENDWVVSTAGRLSKEKNQLMFLKSAYDLNRKHKNVKFLMVGAGPEEKVLINKVTEYDMASKVMFTGRVEDMSSVYIASDVFILTSLTEGLPLTILEAMAARIPVISTNVGGIADLIKDNKTGLLVSLHDARALTLAIEKLLNDKNLYDSLKEDAFKYVSENFNEDIMIKSYRTVYEETLKK